MNDKQIIGLAAGGSLLLLIVAAAIIYRPTPGTPPSTPSPRVSAAPAISAPEPTTLPAVAMQEDGERKAGEQRDQREQYAAKAAKAPRVSAQRQWYQGGTLHKKTIKEWRRATYADRLATAADFVTATARKTAIFP